MPKHSVKLTVGLPFCNNERTLAAAMASRLNRSTSSASPASSPARTLMASRWPLGSSASYTVPMLPRPILRTSR